MANKRVMIVDGYQAKPSATAQTSQRGLQASGQQQASQPPKPSQLPQGAQSAVKPQKS